MQTSFEAVDVEFHRIRYRLVQAGDPELTRARPVRVGRERHDVADGEMGFLEQLTRNEYVSLRRGSGEPCTDEESENRDERASERATTGAAHPSIMPERTNLIRAPDPSASSRPLHSCKVQLMKLTLVSAVVACIATGAIAFAQRPAAPSPDIHYVPTSNGVADAMLKLANTTAADVVYDLGSGDGRIVIAAAKKYGARGVGIEIDPQLINDAAKNAAKAGVADKVTFHQEDLFKTDLSDATVVTLYLSNSINMRLRTILQRQLKPGARIVSHRFLMGDWKPEAERRLEGTSIYLWTIR